MDASCSGTFLPYTHNRITDFFFQAGTETILANSLLETSQEMDEDWGIKTFYVPYLPRRIYIEAPGIVEIQELLKFSAYSQLTSRCTRISDDDRSFVYGTIPDVPSPGSWVRITQTGIYKGDLALVLSAPSEGDVVSIVAVPRLDVSKNKKRKGTGLHARPAQTLLDPTFLANYPLNDNNVYSIRSRLFHRLGLEILRAPSAHALTIEPRPSQPELLLFQSSLERLDVTNETGEVAVLIRRAVNNAFRIESRRLWRTGDQVRILEGAFKDAVCSVHEIDEANGFAVVEVGSPNPTLVEVGMEDLERHFNVGDQVRVAIGENKGSTGSIVKISNGVGTIVERTANQLTEVNPPSILFHLLIILPSFLCLCYLLRAIPWPLRLPLLLIQRLHPQRSPSRLTNLRLRLATRCLARCLADVIRE